MMLDNNYFVLVNLILFATCVSVILSQDNKDALASSHVSDQISTEKVRSHTYAMYNTLCRRFLEGLNTHA